MPAYNVGPSRSCPPQGALQMECNLYLAINGRQPAARDFQSKAERDKCSPDICKGWGLSVWPNMEAVTHAIDAMPWVRTKKIVKFAISEESGCVMATPSIDQPDHHTFWKDRNLDLTTSCEIVVTPGNQ